MAAELSGVVAVLTLLREDLGTLTEAVDRLRVEMRRSREELQARWADDVGAKLCTSGDWLTVREVAKRTSRTESWIYQHKDRFEWRKDGEAANARIRISKQSVDAFIAAGVARQRSVDRASESPRLISVWERDGFPEPRRRSGRSDA